jgi:chemotaxis protein methyltransferase CheR
VRRNLKAMVKFGVLNLLVAKGFPEAGSLDVIFCRNVMIYFDKDTQLTILKKFAPLLRSEGLLFAGHSESFFHASAIFKLRGSTVYELVGK